MLLRGGVIFDGTGRPGRPGDLALAGGRVAAVAAPGEIAEAAQVLEIPGRAVAPGFLDLHCHHDLLALVEPQLEAPLGQGITLEVNGQCGVSPFPLPTEGREAFRQALPVFESTSEWGWGSAAEYLDALRQSRPAVNLVSFVGHGTLRALAAGLEPRPLTEAEQRRMESAAAEAFAAGAGGLSGGLVYPPGSCAPTEELVRLARVAAEHDRLVSFHIRGEDQRLLGSLREAVEIAERSGARVEISHLKASGPPNWGQMPEALALIEAAADRGVRIGFDHYPYTAGSTYLSAYLPAWVTAGDWAATAGRLRDPDLRRRLREELERSLHPDFSRIRISGVATEANRDLVGQGVTPAAAERGQDLADFLAELLLAEDNRVMSLYFSMGDADLELALAHPLGALGTDSLAVGQAPHPRCYGSAPRLLGRYVRERGLLRLEEAIRKLTSLPAERLGLADRGRLAPGCAADVVVFDPATILDTATYENPRQFPVGIEYVLVNGEIAAEKGKLTGKRAGQVL